LYTIALLFCLNILSCETDWWPVSLATSETEVEAASENARVKSNANQGGIM